LDLGQQFLAFLANPFTAMGALLLMLLTPISNEVLKRFGVGVSNRIDPYINKAIDIAGRAVVPICLVIIAIFVLAQIRTNQWWGFALGGCFTAVGALVFLRFGRRWGWEFARQLGLETYLAAGFLVGVLIAIPVVEFLKPPPPRSVFIASFSADQDHANLPAEAAARIWQPLNETLDGNGKLKVRQQTTGQPEDFSGGTWKARQLSARRLDSEYEPAFLAVPSYTPIGADRFAFSGVLYAFQKDKEAITDHAPQAWPTGLEKMAAAAMSFRLAKLVIDNGSQDGVDAKAIEERVAKTYCLGFLDAAFAGVGVDYPTLEGIAGANGADCKTLTVTQKVLNSALDQIQPKMAAKGAEAVEEFRAMRANWCEVFPVITCK
jgi:hypothetical protein